jgi:hypothetical protein
LLAITPATATSVFTCLGHPGQRDRDRIFSIYVVPPKVAKARLSRVAVAGIIALTFANGNIALDIFCNFYLVKNDTTFLTHQLLKSEKNERKFRILMILKVF